MTAFSSNLSKKDAVRMALKGSYPAKSSSAPSPQLLPLRVFWQIYIIGEWQLSNYQKWVRQVSWVKFGTLPTSEIRNIIRNGGRSDEIGRFLGEFTFIKGFILKANVKGSKFETIPLQA